MTYYYNNAEKKASIVLNCFEKLIFFDSNKVFVLSFHTEKQIIENKWIMKENQRI